MPWRLETASGFAPAIRPYQRQWLRGDVLAGLAAGAVVIPQAMAYATVANMPVQVGLYTCMLPLVVYAFIGGSRAASVTSTSTIATRCSSMCSSIGPTARDMATSGPAARFAFSMNRKAIDFPSGDHCGSAR